MTTIEKDEELEKFIDKCETKRLRFVARKVAAFSAKRERERTIEECSEQLKFVIPLLTEDAKECFITASEILLHMK
jgi:hypothetical protein